MNSNLNLPENARLLSEVSAEELAAIVGGLNTMLWDSKTSTGVLFSTTGPIFWSTGNGRTHVLN
jgi:hypothetical protein